MRVLVITPSYPQPDDQQAAIFVHRQIAGLTRLGVSCRVIHFRASRPRFPRWLLRRNWLRYYWGRLWWKDGLDGVPIDEVFFQQLWTPGEDVIPAISSALVRHVESSPELAKTDVVYAHWLWPGGAAALALREHFGWPVVVISRGSEMHDWQSNRPHCRPYVERVLREADQVLANCNDLRDRAASIVTGVGQRIEVVYNGCDSDEFRPAQDRVVVRRELGIEPDAKVIVFCGEVTKRKGIIELAEAWPGFSALHPEWRLIVVGKETEPDVGRQLRSSASDRVMFVGALPQASVIKYLQAGDAYVQPSRLEGLANATMEAMAAGLPVVTTDTCGQRELIQNGENGWLVPANDSTALGLALRELASNDELAERLGRAARRTIETRFNPRRETARLAAILETVCHQRSYGSSRRVTCGSKA